MCVLPIHEPGLTEAFPLQTTYVPTLEMLRNRRAGLGHRIERMTRKHSSVQIS